MSEARTLLFAFPLHFPGCAQALTRMRTRLLQDALAAPAFTQHWRVLEAALTDARMRAHAHTAWQNMSEARPTCVRGTRIMATATSGCQTQTPYSLLSPLFFPAHTLSYLLICTSIFSHAHTSHMLSYLVICSHMFSYFLTCSLRSSWHLALCGSHALSYLTLLITSAHITFIICSHRCPECLTRLSGFLTFSRTYFSHFSLVLILYALMAPHCKFLISHHPLTYFTNCTL